MAKKSGFKKAVGNFFSSLSNSTKSIRIGVGNSIRSLRRRKKNLDYVYLNVSGSLPEREPEPVKFIQRQVQGVLGNNKSELSLERLNQVIEQVIDAGIIKGVVVHLEELTAGFATTQNLRCSLQRLKNAGIQVIVYTPTPNLPHYFVATIADHIIVPPPVEWEVLGFYSETQFLKDALKKIGVQMDVVQISPYKSAMDRFGKSEMSPELREQMNWLLGDLYDHLVSAIVAGRKLSESEVKTFIDNAPFSIQDAQEKGLVDHVAYEDEIPALLDYGKEDKPEKLPRLSDVLKLLPRKARRKTRKTIGVVSIEGGINMGESRNSPVPVPLVGGKAAGSTTVLQQMRLAEQDDSLAALVVHVESPGGSAVASDLMVREIGRLRKKMPVVIYMGNVAASGGYYVSADSDHIMSQSGTITGSIGVISARVSTEEMRNKLDIGRDVILKGENAGLYRESVDMTEQERAAFMRSIDNTYVQFKELVARGRDLPYETLDEICLGKVWTGNQAIGHKLVDSHGDMVDAIQKAADLANLKIDKNSEIRTTNIYAEEGSSLLPEPFGVTDAVQFWLKGEMPQLLNGKPLLMSPFEIKIW